MSGLRAVQGLMARRAYRVKAAPPERKREAGSALLRSLIALLDAEERRRELDAGKRRG